MIFTQRQAIDLIVDEHATHKFERQGGENDQNDATN